MIDLEKIKILYQFGKNLNLADVQALIKASKKNSYKAGTLILQAGDKKKDVYFIRKGLVRGYKINDKGDEITTLVRWENKVVASPQIILFNQPSQLYLETLEPTDVFCIDYDILQEIISSNPKLEVNRKYFLQSMLKETLQRIDSFVLLTPEERYLNFVKEKPDIINRVPDKFIANILGITPVSLSRIRKRIVSRKNN